MNVLGNNTWIEYGAADLARFVEKICFYALPSVWTTIQSRVVATPVTRVSPPCKLMDPAIQSGQQLHILNWIETQSRWIEAQFHNGICKNICLFARNSLLRLLV